MYYVYVMILNFDRLFLRTTIASVMVSKKGKPMINLAYSDYPTDYQSGSKHKQKIYHIKSKKIFGLSDIMYNKTSGDITIDIGWMIAFEDYYNMINKNNIRQIFTNLNQNPFIQFDIDKLYESALVEKCDVTINLKVKDEIDNYYKVIKETTIMGWFDTMHKVSDTQLRIQSDAKSRDEDLLFYDKYRQLSTEQRPFIKKYDILDQFRQVLRLERWIDGEEWIRLAFFDEWYKGDIFLKDLLYAKKHPVADLFCEIFKDVKLFSKYGGVDGYVDSIINSDEEYVGYANKLSYLWMIQVIQFYKKDLAGIQDFIRKYAKSNYYTELPKYNEVLNYMQDNHSLGLLEEIFMWLGIITDRKDCRQVMNAKWYQRGDSKDINCPPIDDIGVRIKGKPKNIKSAEKPYERPAVKNKKK